MLTKYKDQIKTSHPEMNDNEHHLVAQQAEVHIRLHIMNSEKKIQELDKTINEAKKAIDYAPCFIVSLQVSRMRTVERLEMYKALLAEQF